MDIQCFQLENLVLLSLLHPYVTELCTGGELFDRIVEKGHYSEKDAAYVFRTMMRTIAHCHNLGVIHRCAAQSASHL